MEAYVTSFPDDRRGVQIPAAAAIADEFPHDNHNEKRPSLVLANTAAATVGDSAPCVRSFSRVSHDASVFVGR
jgi:hypothetical protein